MGLKIEKYLGEFVSTLLADAPFKHWPVEKSFEEGVDPVIYYVFKQHGLDLHCDQDEKIGVIFLHADKLILTNNNQFEINFSLNRKQTIEQYGQPSKSGGPSSDSILGEYGPWDRFTMKGYTIHIEYHLDADRIKMVTLMQPDMVP